jgi:hypothetical protein
MKRLRLETVQSEVRRPGDAPMSSGRYGVRSLVRTTIRRASTTGRWGIDLLPPQGSADGSL